MTNKKEITLAELGEKIEYLIKKAEQESKYQCDGTLSPNTPTELEKNDCFYGHIEITNSKWEDKINVKWEPFKNLSIKKLIIQYITGMESLQIDPPLGYKLFDILEFVDIEFVEIESEDNKPVDEPSKPIMLTVIANRCLDVKWTKCIAKGQGNIALQYNMPDENTIGNEITIKSCNITNFTIIAKSPEVNIHNSLDSEVKNSTDTEEHISPDSGAKNSAEPEEHNSPGSEVKKSAEMEVQKTPDEITRLNLLLMFDKNTFTHFAISLSKSISDGYEYNYSAKLINRNVIRKLVIWNEYPDMRAWGTREKIGESIAKDYKTINKNASSIKDIGYISPIRRARGDIETNKAVLTMFRKLADDKGDRFQESTINYHIATCDEQLVRLEKYWGFIQDKLIMKFGRLLSRHGTSWAWPLTWIFVFNFIVATIVFHILNDSICLYFIKDCKFWYIIGEIFNPLSTPTGIAEGIKGDKYDPFKGSYIVLAISVLLSKAFYAMCIYEFVRAARRFTLK
ncbi:MAG: hypothetical protein K0U41_03850 [Gammaproteobacteria bacterium]|nr:hypothetical protein [Gammaproteobacteria bacterium]